MSAMSRRLRGNAGWLTLLGVLCLAATLLLVASPRVANRHTDRGLAEWVSSLDYLSRDITYRLELAAEEAPERPELRPPQAQSWLGALRGELADPLAQRLAASWYGVQANGFATGEDLEWLDVIGFIFTVREQSGAEDEVRLIDGDWPMNARVVNEAYEVALSAKVSEEFGLKVGSRLEIVDGGPVLPVVVVGIFEPLDRGAGIWAEQSEVFEPYTPVGLDPAQPWRATLLTDTSGMTAAASRLGDILYTWRYRVDETALDTASLPTMIEAAFDARRQSEVEGAVTFTGLDSALARFQAQVTAAQSLLAVVQVGVLTTLFGLVILAAMAAMQRRHGELSLLRSRGASLVGLGRRVLAESAPVVAIAVAAGYLVGRMPDGRPGDTEWIALVFGVAAVLTAPVLAMATHRQASVATSRSELSRPRVSARRLMGEATVVALAALGAVLLRRRGLGDSVDLYLVLVPVLVGVAAAIVTLRVFPYPLRALASLAARARGAVPFLGLARAGRASAASAGPLAVLVVAVSVGVFCTNVEDSVSAARDRVADLKVPGAAIVRGGLFTVETWDLLAAVPGVTDVAFLSVNFNSPLASSNETDARRLESAVAVVVDGPELARVLAASGNSGLVPRPLLDATRQEGSAPAVVSPSVAADLAGLGAISVQSYRYGFTVAAVADTFPGLDIGTDRFVVLPRQALIEPPGKPVLPTAFALAGAGFDADTLTRIGDEQQRAWITSVTGRPAGDLGTPTAVLTHAQARANLENGGVDRVVGYTFLVGAAAGLVLALLAVGFSVASGARARGQALSRLRTMGLASGQGRRLIAYELLPLIALGALVGAVVGAVVPRLVGPALGLSALSDGAEVMFVLDPRLAALAFGVVVIAVLVAMTVEAMMNRSSRLGAVLRVGGES